MTGEGITKNSTGFEESTFESENFNIRAVNSFYAKDRPALRKWLEENHSTA